MDLSSETITLNSESDIIELESAVRDKISFDSLQTIEILILSVKQPKLLITYGFLPAWWMTSNWIEDYINGMSNEGLKFWHQVENAEELLQATYWSYSTISYYKQRGIENAESLPLLLYSPDLVYRLSKRPKNDMLMFRSPTSPTVTRENVFQESENPLIQKVLVDGVTWNAIPVTRYTAGMRRGLYLGLSREEEFCGTFYYNEVESDTFLAYNTKRIYRSKYEAILDLDPDLKISKSRGVDFDKFNTLAKGYLLKKGIGSLVMRTKVARQSKKFEEIRIPDDLVLSAIDAQKILYPTDLQKILEAKLVPKNEKKYIGPELELYALEDELDQSLCYAARLKGIDIIIFTNMVGSHQIVIEILDSRSRRESFDNLIYLV